MLARAVLGLVVAGACALGPVAARAEETPLPSLWTERFRQAPFEASFSDDRWLGERREYWLPLGEVVLFDALLNLVNRHTIGNEYKSTIHSIRDNLHSSWTIDRDPFSTNQLAHPYQGSMHYGFARSVGLSFWESTGYALAGSALWEIAGETTPPSANDLINTGIGGSFMGESLFRLASLLLENDEVPPLWREFGAALIQPSTGFNRLAFGKRFDQVFASRNPATYSRADVGFSGTAEQTTGTSTTKLDRNELQADYAIDYGLPGKPGYAYRRPFDLFSFQATRFDQRATGLIQNVAVAVDTQLRGGSLERRMRFQLENVGEITNRGWEMQAGLHRGALGVSGTLTTVDSRVRTVADGYLGDLRVGDRMLAVPARTSSLAASWTQPRWTLALTATRAEDWVNYDRVALARAYTGADGTQRDVTGARLRSYWRDYSGQTHLRLSASRDVGRGLTLTQGGLDLLEHVRSMGAAANGVLQLESARTMYIRTKGSLSC